MSRCVSVSPRSCHTTWPIWNLVLEVLIIFIQMACDLSILATLVATN